MSDTDLTTDELAAWMDEWMNRELELRVERVDRDRPFIGYGMDSIHATMLVGDLEERLGRRLSPTLTWDHPTIAALARHLTTASVAAPR
ncbi:MAG: acyl carrier protein [Gemmatirosa sp.]|nr:acyl carrier protein [Gemmatirosa sp.]